METITRVQGRDFVARLQLANYALRGLLLETHEHEDDRTVPEREVPTEDARKQLELAPPRSRIS